MTPKEYGQLAEWVAEGKAEYRGGEYDWRKAIVTMQYEDAKDCPFSMYRRTPDVPEMPDELWVSSYVFNRTASTVPAFRDKEKAAYCNSEPVRYVRAGAVLTPEMMQVREMPDAWWRGFNGHVKCEYRIKP